MNKELTAIKKRVLKYCNVSLSSIDSEGVPIEKFISEYIINGTKIFESVEIVFGEKEVVRHDIYYVLSRYIYME